MLSLVTYIVVSLATKPTDAAVLGTWQGRLNGTEVAEADDPMRAAISRAIPVVPEQSHR